MSAAQAEEMAAKLNQPSFKERILRMAHELHPSCGFSTEHLAFNPYASDRYVIYWISTASWGYRPGPMEKILPFLKSNEEEAERRNEALYQACLNAIEDFRIENDLPPGPGLPRD